MKEYTVVIDAQITIINKHDTDITDTLDQREIAKLLKTELNADDVIVDEVKVFITKEYDTEESENEQVDHVE